MNVLIVTILTPNSPSGVVAYYQMLAQDLRSQGIQVRVLDASGTPLIWRKFLGLLKRVMRIFGNAGLALYYEFADFVSMYITIRRSELEMPDVIHAQDAKSGVAAYLALGKKIPIVMTCHFNDNPVDELTQRFSLKRGAKKRLNSWYTYLFSYIKNYVFVSNYAYVKSSYLVPANAQKIIIHNTVNWQSITSMTTRVISDKLVISNVGYMDERKNQKLLILIGHELVRRGIANFSIWLIGDGPKRTEYERLVDNLGLTEQIKFYGQQANPWRLVEQTDLYIHTALNDNCPYSIIEAFAVKTPVLALPVGGIPEMLPEQYGLLYGANVEALTDEIEVYFNSENRTQLKKAQAIYADQHFNHHQSLRKLISFYHQTEQAA